MSELKENLELQYHYNEDYIFFTKGVLSQWYGGFRGQNSSFVTFLDGGRSERVNCAEQAMMIHKANLCRDEESITAILAEPHPAQQKKLGRKIGGFVQSEWDAHKLNFVTRVNIEKFTQREHCRNILLDTGDKILVEAAPWDNVWGIGMAVDHPYILEESQWKGENLLGKSLMAARDYLRLVYS